MKNYICINGVKTAITQEQMETLKRALSGEKEGTLGSVPVGETFKIGEYEFIALEHSEGTTKVILKDLLHKDKQFGKCNNYEGSYVDDWCNDFEIEIAGVIGEDNLIEHTVDLTSDDGLKDYGKIKRKMSLLTTELYRRYVEILDKHKIDDWWWLATAWSTPAHGNSSTVKCVSPDGFIFNRSYDFNDGVRPFCILNSNIFVSR